MFEKKSIKTMFYTYYAHYYYFIKHDMYYAGSKALYSVGMLSFRLFSCFAFFYFL